MSNSISKNVNFTQLPGRPGSPTLTPGRAPHPLRTYYSNEAFCQFTLIGAKVRYDFVQQQPPTIGAPYPAAQWTPSVTPSSWVVANVPTPITNVFQCQQLDRPVIEIAALQISPSPGLPAAASQTVYDFNFGWNAGARFNTAIDGDASIAFNCTEGVGVAAGFNQDSVTGSYANFKFSWVFIAGHAYVCEPPLSSITPIRIFDAGLFAKTDTYAIKRFRTLITYWKNGTLVYTSLNPSTGRVYFDTAFFAGGDTVDNPVVTVLNTGFGTAVAPRAVGGLVTYRYANVRARFMTCSGGVKNRGLATEAPCRTVAGAGRPVYGQSIVVAQLATSSSVSTSQPGLGGGGLPAPIYALCNVNMVPPVLYGNSPTGQKTVSMTSVAQPARMFAGHTGASKLAASAAPATSYGYSYETSKTAFMNSVVGMDDLQSTLNFFLVTMTSSGLMTSVSTYTFGMTAAMMSLFTASSTLGLRTILQAIMNSQLNTTAVAPLLQETTTEIWCVNTDTNASWMYESYAYNSFAKLGDTYYGMKADGLYQLTGDTDAGAAIHASASFGQLDFGSLGFKHMHNVYVGVSSNNTMLLKVTVNGVEYIYTARAASPNMSTQRFDLGKGLRSNYYTLELFNQAGADFQLDEIEFRPYPTTRKI